MTKPIPQKQDKMKSGMAVRNPPEDFFWESKEQKITLHSEGHYEVQDYSDEIEWKGQKRSFVTFELTLLDNLIIPPTIGVGPRVLLTKDADILFEWASEEGLTWDMAQLAWPLTRILDLSEIEIKNLYDKWKESTLSKLYDVEKTLNDVNNLYTNAATPIPGINSLTRSLQTYYRMKTKEVKTLRKSRLKLIAAASDPIITALLKEIKVKRKVENILDSLIIKLTPDSPDTRSRNIMKAHGNLFNP